MTASSGALQKPAHSTALASSLADCKFVPRAVQASRNGCKFVQKLHAGSQLVGASAGADRRATNCKSCTANHGVCTPGVRAVKFSVNEWTSRASPFNRALNCGRP